jgi:hypothetical protein
MQLQPCEAGRSFIMHLPYYPHSRRGPHKAINEEPHNCTHRQTDSTSHESEQDNHWPFVGPQGPERDAAQRLGYELSENNRSWPVPSGGAITRSDRCRHHPYGENGESVGRGKVFLPPRVGTFAINAKCDWVYRQSEERHQETHSTGLLDSLWPIDLRADGGSFIDLSPKL